MQYDFTSSRGSFLDRLANKKANPSSRKDPWFHNTNQPSFAKRKRKRGREIFQYVVAPGDPSASLVATLRQATVVLFSVVILLVLDGIVCWLRARTVWAIESVLVRRARCEYAGFDFLPRVGDVWFFFGSRSELVVVGVVMVVHASWFCIPTLDYFKCNKATFDHYKMRTGSVNTVFTSG